MTSENKTIRAGWLIDGTGKEAVKDCLIGIAGEKFINVGAVNPDNEVPPEYTDFSDCTIITGIVDSHTHLTMSGSLDPAIRDIQITDEYDSAVKRVKKHVRGYLKYGVVAIRDGGDFHAHVLRYKNEIRSPMESLLTIHAAGNGYHIKGRYGQLLGTYLEPGRDLARAIIEDYKPGIDHIKIVNSGMNSLREFGRETSPQFTKDELKRAVKAAESIGLKVMVHANGKIPVQLAIEAGCQTIEHGFFMGDDNFKRMADNGVTWVPTACTMKAYMEDSAPDTNEHNVAKKNLSSQLEQMEKALGYGVTMALGTDAGCPGVYHGPSIIDEFELLIKAGNSIVQAVKCATSNAVRILDEDIDNNILAKGMPATFVVTKGAPNDLPESLKNIHEVWIKGKKISFMDESF